MSRKEERKLGCSYTGYDFGAHYIDTCCIDGFLWDLDSGGIGDNGENYLDHGGEHPCPECNRTRHIEYFSDEWIDVGYCSVGDKLEVKKIKNIMPDKDSNFRRKAKRYFQKGKRQHVGELKGKKTKNPIPRKPKVGKYHV